LLSFLSLTTALRDPECEFYDFFKFLQMFKMG